MIWHWLDVRGVPAGVLEFWVGSIPVVGIPGAIWHRVTERRHRERVAAIRSLAKPTMVSTSAAFTPEEARSLWKDAL